MIDPVAVIPHDAHRTTGELSQTLCDALFDLVKHPSGYAAVWSNFKDQVRNAGIIAQRAVVFLRSFSIGKNLLQHPLGLFVPLRCDGPFICLLFILPERRTCSHKSVPYKTDSIIFHR